MRDRGVERGEWWYFEVWRGRTGTRCYSDKNVFGEWLEGAQENRVEV
jgi:hypothetical protein